MGVMPATKKIRGFLVFLAAASISGPSFAQSPTEIRITADEFSFTPAQIQVRQGQYKITVTNEGGFPHGLAIVGLEGKITYIEPGETKSLTIRFDREARYIFYCPQAGHREKGMEGKITAGTRKSH